MPVNSPLASIIAKCTSDPLAFLAESYAEVLGAPSKLLAYAHEVKAVLLGQIDAEIDFPKDPGNLAIAR